MAAQSRVVTHWTLRQIKQIQSRSRLVIPCSATFGRHLNTNTNRSLVAEMPPAARFYQRTLPKNLIPFSSTKGRAVFQEALASGHMGQFFFLSEQFGPQDEPTFCGLSTLAMVLNSLRIDPMRAWKGAWRWFDEHNLGCSGAGTTEVRERGLTFDSFNRLAECNGAVAEAHRAPMMTNGATVHKEFVENFRATVQSMCSSPNREFIVACYSRKSLGQTGSGHFSPIGGYHEASDSVLIMDVATCKYPMHWVPLVDIAQAMQEIDPAIGRTRGFVLLRAPRGKDEAMPRINPMDVKEIPKAAAKRLSHDISNALASSECNLCQLQHSTSWTEAAMCRWLQAVSSAGAELLRQTVQVKNDSAVKEVIARLARVDMFRELCEAYSSLIKRGVVDGFPPTRFVELSSVPDTAVEELGLNSCGELWVIILMLMPEHLRSAVACELSGASVPELITQHTPRTPPTSLEALRTALQGLFEPPNSKTCPRGSCDDCIFALS